VHCLLALSQAFDGQSQFSLQGRSNPASPFRAQQTFPTKESQAPEAQRQPLSAMPHGCPAMMVGDGHVVAQEPPTHCWYGVDPLPLQGQGSEGQSVVSLHGAPVAPLDEELHAPTTMAPSRPATESTLSSWRRPMFISPDATLPTPSTPNGGVQSAGKARRQKTSAEGGAWSGLKDQPTLSNRSLALEPHIVSRSIPTTRTHRTSPSRFGAGSSRRGSQPPSGRTRRRQSIRTSRRVT
jgi:hypothetical protein